MGRYAHGIRAIARRKLFLGVVLVLAGLIGAGLLLFRSSIFASETVVHNTSPESKAALAAANAAITEALKDSDQDGLRDWEEAIYHTDPQKPDTDGDGTPDGEETKQNRDPLKKGPNDKATPITSDDSSSGTLEVDPKNLSQNFTKALFESGALNAIDQNGEITSTDFLANLKLPDSMSAESLFANIPSVSKKDLKLIDTNDVSAIRNYFTDAGNIYQKNLGSFPESDVIIFTKALEENNPDSLGQLDAQANAVKTTADEIQKLSVPSQYADEAIQEIKNLREIERAMELMRNLQQDPLAAYFAFQKRIELIDEMSASTAALRDELVKKGVIQQ